MSMAGELLKNFIRQLTSYNWPLYIITVKLLCPTPLHHNNIMCCNPITKLVLSNIFSSFNIYENIPCMASSQQQLSRLQSWHSHSSLIFCHSFHIIPIIRELWKLDYSMQLMRSSLFCPGNFYKLFKTT